MNIIESAGFFTGPMNSCEHSHTCCEIFYFKKGKIKLNIEGKEYYPKENSVHIISPMEKHAITCLSDDYERYLIFLNLYGFEAYFSNPTLTAVLKNRPIEFKHIFHPPHKDVETIFHRCAEEYENNSSCQFYKLRMVNLISELLILLYRSAPEQFSYYHDNGRLAQIQNYLEINYAKPVKIQEVADLFFINKYYLSHTFKLFTGYSPKQYLKKVRLMHVCQLLTETDLKIEVIALQTGFDSLNDLSRQFKSNFGLSPRDFRMNHGVISIH